MSNVSSGRKEDIVAMLSSPDKWMSKSKNFIALMARKVLFDMNMTPNRFQTLVNIWLAKVYKKEGTPLSKVATDRHNFFGEMTNDNMTANTFQKMLRAIGASNVEIVVKIDYPGRAESTVSRVTFTDNVNSGGGSDAIVPLQWMDGLELTEEEIDEVANANKDGLRSIQDWVNARQDR